MQNYVYFDSEWVNGRTRSICQIALITDSNKFTQSIFINPDDHFDDYCVRVHGITPDIVNESPLFPEIWAEIAPYFTNGIIVGHNVAAADLCALSKNLQRYGIPIPEDIRYICTLEIAKKVFGNEIGSLRLSSLCDYFGIEIDQAHDAYSDAKATQELLGHLIADCNINPEDYIRQYIPNKSSGPAKPRCSTDYRKRLNFQREIEYLYGIVRGIALDHTINQQEVKAITEWRNRNISYVHSETTASLFPIIDSILADGIITITEAAELQKILKDYINTEKSSSVTLATQELDGIMKGISADRVINDEECKGFQMWLHNHAYLAGIYPFDEICATIDGILADGIVTDEESNFLVCAVNDLLDPVSALSCAVNTVYGKRVCLSGNFEHGQKKMSWLT